MNTALSMLNHFEGNTMTNPDITKAIAKKKRIISEVAGQIHDIVEDSLWTEYSRLPLLSEQILQLMADLESYKQEHAVT